MKNLHSTNEIHRTPSRHNFAKKKKNTLAPGLVKPMLVSNIFPTTNVLQIIKKENRRWTYLPKNVDKILISHSNSIYNHTDENHCLLTTELTGLDRLVGLVRMFKKL